MSGNEPGRLDQARAEPEITIFVANSNVLDPLQFGADQRGGVGSRRDQLCGARPGRIAALETSADLSERRLMLSI